MIGVLNEAGLRALRRDGHAATAAACAPDLASCDVRFLDDSKRRPLETASESGLAALFSAPFPARPVVLTSLRGDGCTASLELRVPPDLACLRGHFPTLPIVPGAAQLGWAVEFGAEFLGTATTMRACSLVKFERIIQPGRLLRLRIAAETDASRIHFEISSALGRHSSGRIETGSADG